MCCISISLHVTCQQKKFRRVRTLDSDEEEEGEEGDKEESEKRSIATRVSKELEEVSCCGVAGVLCVNQAASSGVCS